MSQNAKLTLAIVLAAVLTGVAVIAIAGGADEQSEPAAEVPDVAPEDAQVIRDSSHRLQEAPDGKVTVVEFLDFECEGCRALFPVIEQLREEYEGQVTFAIRYFPLDAHFNAQLAAQTVEAASKQGKLEEMYVKMYETQSEWGEQQVSARDTFFGFAEELGLDMEKFEADLDSPETAERVALDQADGLALGVDSTPTLFLNGEPLEPGSYEQMKSEIDAALGSA